MDYNEYLEKLLSESHFFRARKKPTLHNMINILIALGNPDLTPKFRTLIGGTAGKGTVCRYIEAYAIKNNLSIITLVSPHIQTPLERIRINGKIISKEDFENQIKILVQMTQKTGLFPSYYEAMVLIGVLLAHEKKIDILNCEIGLGGKYDACNAIKGRRVCAITFIGDDHKEIIGPELEDIAKEKSGIFNEFSLYNISYEENLKTILQSKSKVEFIEFKSPEESNKELAKKLIKFICGDRELLEVDNVKLPCRFEEIDTGLILDGAHSEPRFKHIKDKLEKLNEKFTVIFAMTSSHEPRNLKIINKYIDKLIVTHVDTHRDFWEIDELQKIFPNAERISNPLDALYKAKKYENKILVIGSFYLCGIIRDEYIPTEEIIFKQSEFR